ncbi:MAG: FMN-binding negative transcriptional regulator [Actinomycetota bacterium]
MLIHPWDAPLDDAEWRTWLAATDRFGVLLVNDLDPERAPLAQPTHFAIAGDELLVHLARPNPIWPALERASEVRLAVVGDHAYVPTDWRAKAGTPETEGVPTSYYATVQFVCVPTVVDDPAGKAAILIAQLADAQPEGGHVAVDVDAPPYGPMLPGIRGVRLAIRRVEAKFKYDDHKPVDLRERVSDRLDARGRSDDAGAAAEQRRRTSAIGEWRPDRRA